jgi:hypothetical protein
LRDKNDAWVIKKSCRCVQPLRYNRGSRWAEYQYLNPGDSYKLKEFLVHVSFNNEKNSLRCHPVQVVPKNEWNDPYPRLSCTRQRLRSQTFHWHAMLPGEQELLACGKIYRMGLCYRSGHSKTLTMDLERPAKQRELKQRNQGLNIVVMFSV